MEPRPSGSRGAINTAATRRKKGMASLKNSEKRLLIIFAVALFFVANFLVMGNFSGRRQVAESEIENFREEILDFEDEQSEQPDWLATRAMLQLIEPRFVSEEAAATEIENWLKQCATLSGATIDQIRPDPPIIDPASGYTKVPLGVKLSGSDAQVTQFVSYVTLAGWAESGGSMAKFYNIPEITFTGDKKDPTVLRCTLVVTRWYANNASAANRLLPAPAPAAPAVPAPVAPAVPAPVEPAVPAPITPANNPLAVDPLTEDSGQN